VSIEPDAKFPYLVFVASRDFGIKADAEFSPSASFFKRHYFQSMQFRQYPLSI
jgi:hypothetical protein